MKTRLKQAMIDKAPMQNAQEEETVNTNVFAGGACWKVLKPEAAEVEDPATNAQFRDPTLGKEEELCSSV